jgi:transcriptional regulator with PAS, ATPase and Fis domain
VRTRHAADADGNLAYANSICRNTSEIKLLEAELRDANTELERRVDEQTAALWQNQEMLRAILDNAPVAISVTDLEGRYTVMNRYMRQTFGVTEAQVFRKLQVMGSGPIVGSSVLLAGASSPADCRYKHREWIMTHTPAIPNHALLSAEERAMLAQYITDVEYKPFAQVASETGIHPDILNALSG